MFNKSFQIDSVGIKDRAGKAEGLSWTRYKVDIGDTVDWPEVLKRESVWGV